MFAAVITILLLVVAVCVVVMNWLYAYLNYRNQRAGVAQHISMVPIVAQIFVLLSWFVHEPLVMPWFPTVVFIVIALADFSMWYLSYGVLRHLLKKS